MNIDSVTDLKFEAALKQVSQFEPAVNKYRPDWDPKDKAKAKEEMRSEQPKKMAISLRHFVMQPDLISIDVRHVRRFIMGELAVSGGKKTKQKPFPMWPQYDERSAKPSGSTRQPGLVANSRHENLAFEQEFAKFHGAKHGIAVTNGTAALEVTMAALGIGHGDEVIVPDFTFVATASAVLFAGALPVTVDVSPETYCLDPKLTEAAITPRTKAIIAVHMGGRPRISMLSANRARKKGLPSSKIAPTRTPRNGRADALALMELLARSVFRPAN